MRILLVHNRYRSAQPSGENRVVDHEQSLLRELGGHEVQRYDRSSDDIASFDMVQKTILPMRVIWSGEDAKFMRRVLKDFAPHIVHVHNVFPLISASILGACASARIPVVATLHNFRLVCASGDLLRDGRPCVQCVASGPLPSLRYGCYRGSRTATAPLAASIAVHRRLRTWERNVQKFIVMSRFAKDIMTNAGLPSESVVIKAHSVTEPPAHQGAQFEDCSVYLGRLSREKGVDLLVDAWRPEFGKLLIIGDGEDRTALEAQAARHGRTIEFLGSRPHQEAMELLSRARVLIAPSRCQETFGLSAVEAAARGVPAVVPAGSAPSEVVVDGVTGRHFKSGDSESLSTAVSSVLLDKRSKRLGAAARIRFLTHYTDARNLKALEEIYEDAVSSGHRLRRSHTRN